MQQGPAELAPQRQASHTSSSECMDPHAWQLSLVPSHALPRPPSLQPAGVGTVVAGTVKRGVIAPNATLLLGPDMADGSFKAVQIKSLHYKRLPVSQTHKETMLPGPWAWGGAGKQLCGCQGPPPQPLVPPSPLPSSSRVASLPCLLPTRR